jgi:hypothetical protein
MKQDNSLIKILGVGLALYGAYKLLEYTSQTKLVEKKVEPSSEEEYVSSLIEELSGIKNKTKETKDKIELLKIKLNQLKKQKI